ncbi:MAG: hypothetical protein DMD83_17230 [Candidatus Rokuibacteriota bacterium]|nr:MAG: hypothetical protein DMD83_17230 [Candidatus Rokubacteria bacterium]
MIERQALARPRYTTPRGRRLGGSDGSAVRITAHFWVADRLYEVDYDRAARSDGRTRLIRVQGSERRCRCPARDDAEEGRRERGMWYVASLRAGSMGSWRRR